MVFSGLHRRFLSLSLWVRRSVKVALVIALAVGGYASYAGILQAMGNFHVVEEGVLYRSSQPTTEQIISYHEQYGIKSIINLRGENAGRAWYDAETRTAQSLGIKHINFRMSSRQILTQDKALALIEVLKTAPKPVLVHCYGGADRSGLASALFLAAVANKGEEESEDQISFRFGHLSIPFLSSAYAMDQTFENMEPWLGYEGS